MNSDLSDIAAALTASIAADGQKTMTGALPMGNQLITSLGGAISETDAINLGDVRNEAYNIAVVGGTANAITLALTPALTAGRAGQRFKFKPASTNTGPATLKIDAQSANPILLGGEALTGGELRADTAYEVIDDGAGNYHIIGSSKSIGDGTVSLPGLAFGRDTNTGIYRVGADQFALVCGGAVVLTIGPGLIFKFGASGASFSTAANTPEGAVTAPVGSLFLRTDGSTSTTLYVKTSGSGNTGWTAK
jgi:hypothetical protein